ncbi:hypothetical protein AB6869_12575 [Rahnella rivi]|uniref:hypothetical protein n=1 Tax=Rahnella rivi TaxID=2816249 RepID=UPI0039BE1C62
MSEEKTKSDLVIPEGSQFSTETSTDYSPGKENIALAVTAAGITYNGTTGNDSFTGGTQDDHLSGGAGDDSLIGGAGADVIDGGAGNDYLSGGTGLDTFIFKVGHGQDLINDNLSSEAGNDTLRFTGAKADVGGFSREGNNLVIHAYGTADSVTIENYFFDGESDTSGFRHYSFEFDDITLTESDLATAGIPFYATGENDRIDGWYGRDVLNGGAGDDYLYGGSGDDFLSGGAGDDSLIGWAGADVIDGGAGNDYLSGSTGLDTFMFAVGHGQDLIRDNSSSEAGNDTLRFTGAKADVGGFSREGNNLVIHAYGTADRVTIENYFFDGESETSGYRHYSFEFDDITLTESDLATAGIPFYATWGNDRIDGWYGRDVLNGGAGDDSFYGGSGDDFLSGGAGDDSLVGGAGADVIDGGAGNDYLSGSTGLDTFMFEVGHGQDLITDNSSSEAGNDTLRFTGAKADVGGFSREGNNLVIHAYGTADRVTINNYFMDGESETSGFRHYSFEFDDITLTESDLATAGIPFYATEGDDRIDGWYGRDVLNGGAGDDYLYGGSGEDYISGGAGDDSLTGGAGADVIDGGAGNDYLSGSTGLDTFVFKVGHGQDLITDNFSREAGNDTLRFTGAKADVGGFSREGNNLVIHAYGTADRVTINNYFIDGESETSGTRYYSFEFDDITLTESDLATAGIPFYATAGDDRIDGWYGRDVLNGGVGNDFFYGGSGDDYISGGVGNDSLTGGEGADVIDGGAGNDRLGGRTGLDTFMFEVGHGQDVISDNSSSEAGNDTLRFTGAKADVGGFSREGNNLVIHAYGTADRVTVENYFIDGEIKNGVTRHYSFEFDDITLTESDLATAGIPFYATAGDDRIDGWYGRDVLNGGVGEDSFYGGSGDDFLSGGAGDDSLAGGAGADVIDGGAGNDYLSGSIGLDTFMFEVGHGQDLITNNFSSEAGNDTLRFTGAKADVGGFSREGNNLVIHAYGTADRVTVENYFIDGDLKNSATRHYSFEFDDITLTESDLATARITFSGTDGNDNAHGWYGVDLMNGGGGDDSLSGGSGDDVLNGGVGNDSLYGGAGQDTYLFANGHGNDSVTDFAGMLEGKDIIEFSDLNLTDLWFSKSNSNLLITESGSQDSVEVMNWYSNADSQNKVIHTHDGYEIDAAQVQQLVEAMSTFAATHSELSAADQQTDFMHSVSVSSYLEAAK